MKSSFTQIPACLRLKCALTVSLTLKRLAIIYFVNVPSQAWSCLSHVLVMSSCHVDTMQSHPEAKTITVITFMHFL